MSPIPTINRGCTSTHSQMIALIVPVYILEGSSCPEYSALPDWTAELYSACTPPLRKFIAHRSGRSDACEIAHATMIDAITALQHQRIRNIDHLWAYILTIARRKIHSDLEVRRNLRYDNPIRPIFDSRQDQERDVLAEETRTAVRSAVRRLGDTDREILHWFYVEGENAEAICIRMHLTATQFRNFKHRSICRLRHIIQQDQRRDRLATATHRSLSSVEGVNW